MLTSFNLKPEHTVDDFRRSLATFHTFLQQIDLVETTGPIGRRQKHPVMDTDDERDHEYYFIMSFRDRDQCDRAVEYIYKHQEPVESVHNEVFSIIENPIFTCWEDI